MESIAFVPGFMSTSIKVHCKEKQAIIQCLWKLNNKPVGDKAPFKTLDMIMVLESVRPTAPNHSTSTVPNCTLELLDSPCLDEDSWDITQHGDSGLLSFLQECLVDLIEGVAFPRMALKLVLSSSDGYILRSDVIRRRLLSCDLLIHGLAEFTTPRQHVRHFCTTTLGSGFRLALEQALCAIRLQNVVPTQRLAEYALQELETELIVRLSFPWITKEPLPRLRLAIIEGRPHPSVSAAAEGPFRAASALGIQVVVLDEAGHWLQGDENRHLRDEFLPCDLNLDTELPSRIFEAVSRSRVPVDGIITYSDKLLVATAKAAQRLGLWTNPPEAIEACSHKGRMRELTLPPLTILTTTGRADFKEKFAAISEPLQYPLIIKPTKGTSSENVILVDTERALLESMDKIEDMCPGREFLVEPYICGPEVDANFVLVDGEIMFSEINDDFPSAAEIDARMTSFAESSTIMPTKLPLDEERLLQSSLVTQLGALGLTTGLFHIEARVRNSAMEYSANGHGLELSYNHSERTSQHISSCKPEVVLIEINARTPGHQESIAVEYTYGIDYYALYTLQAVRKSSSCKRSDPVLTAMNALAEPLSGFSRYHTHILFIPVTHGGVFKRAGTIPSSLMVYIPHHRVLMKEGDIILDPRSSGRWPFVAYFVIKATVIGEAGREQVRTLGDCVRHAFQFEIG